MDSGSSSRRLCGTRRAWSEAVAVGSLAFVEKIKGELGVKALHREVEQFDGTYALREPGEAYRTNFDIQNEVSKARKHAPTGENC